MQHVESITSEVAGGEGAPVRGRRREASSRFALVVALLIAGAAPAWSLPGDLDPTFGGDGIVTTPFGNLQDAKAVVIQPDGKIVVAGGNQGSGFSDFCLARYEPDGALDPSFGVSGKVTTDFDGNSDAAEALLLQPDGKLVAAGIAVTPPTGTPRRMVFARYLSNGALDPTFGLFGRVRLTIGDYAIAYDAALQPDGKIVAAGFTNAVGPGSNFVVVRLDSNGSLDSSFGVGGIVNLHLGGSANLGNDDAFAVALQADGKIVVAGRANYHYAIARLRSDGSLDPTFSGDGVVYTDFAGTQDDAFDVLVQPDGNILAVGFLSTGPDFDVTMARYLPNGTLDTGFGSSGKVRENFGALDSATAVLLQPDGKIIVGGSSGYNAILARYQPTGFLDASFGSGGKVYTSFGASTPGRIEGLARQPDGAIVAAGGIGSFAASRDFGVLRYLDNSHTTTVAAATGTWTFQLGPGPNGTLAFDDRPVSIFGHAVNLGTAVGSMPFTGTITGYNGAAGAITMSATSPLQFFFQGDFVCAAAGCSSTDPNTVFAMAPEILGGGLPSGVAWEFDSDDFTWNPASARWEGTFALQAVAPANTPVGSDVTVSGSYVTVTFDNVTGGGTTLISPIGAAPGPLPANFQGDATCFFGGNLQQITFFYDITTDATWSGAAEICFEYNPSAPPLCANVELLHHVGNAWEEVPLTDVPAKHAFCGTVTSLSPFALGRRVSEHAGFVPPDGRAATCSTKVAGALGRLVKSIGRCRTQQADAALRGAAFDAAACEAQASAVYAAVVYSLDGCPTCLIESFASLGVGAAALVDHAAAAAYCEGAAPLEPGSFARVPPDGDAARCSSGLVRAVAPAVVRIGACHKRAAAAARRGQVFDEAACETAAFARYEQRTAALSGCTACAAESFGPVWDLLERGLDRDLSEDLYCAGSVPFP